MLGDRTLCSVPCPVSASIPSVDKDRLAATFGKAAPCYDDCAIVQRHCAAELVSILRNAKLALPEGTILELGCGTGFVTRELVNAFPDRTLEITDLSAEMLTYCQAQISPLRHPSIYFQRLDGEMLATERQYAAIASGFVVQWFDDVERSLKRLSRALVPGGMLVSSFPTSQSFPEWKQICEAVNLPFTGNPMPEVDSLCEHLSRDGLACRYQERWMSTAHNRAIDFFKDLKSIGADMGRSPYTLSLKQFRQLMDAWDAQSLPAIRVSYHIAFLIIQRL